MCSLKTMLCVYFRLGQQNPFVSDSEGQGLLQGQGDEYHRAERLWQTDSGIPCLVPVWRGARTTPGMVADASSWLR